MTACPVRLSTEPSTVPARAPAASELTDPTVTPGDASAGAAASPDNAIDTSAALAARPFNLFMDPSVETKPRRS